MARSRSAYLLFSPLNLPSSLLMWLEEVLSRFELQIHLFGVKENPGLSGYCENGENMRTFRGCCGGGKGVYTFFFVLGGASTSKPAALRISALAVLRSFFLTVFSEVLRWRLRNLGRNRSHGSFASFGSLASSRRIMSSWSTSSEDTNHADEYTCFDSVDGMNVLHTVDYDSPDFLQ
jgi:hypothetical protein